MKHTANALRLACACLVAAGSLQAQNWKPWPEQSTWSEKSWKGRHDLARIVWKDGQLGSIELTPIPGLETDSPVTALSVGKEQTRVEALEEQEGPLKCTFGGLPWPSGTTMIGDPNRPELERAETKEWILYRLTWATTRQGYTPNGILILAWHKPSRHWKSWGCECDSIERVGKDPSKLAFKATGSVNTGDGYRDWIEVVELHARGDRVVLAPGTPHLATIKP